MELLGIGAITGARLASEHSGEVEAENLAAGLGVEIVGDHAGVLEGRQARSSSVRATGLGRLARPGRRLGRQSGGSSGSSEARGRSRIGRSSSSSPPSSASIATAPASGSSGLFDLRVGLGLDHDGLGLDHDGLGLDHDGLGLGLCLGLFDLHHLGRRIGPLHGSTVGGSATIVSGAATSSVPAPGHRPPLRPPRLADHGRAVAPGRLGFGLEPLRLHGRLRAWRGPLARSPAGGLHGGHGHPDRVGHGDRPGELRFDRRRQARPAVEQAEQRPERRFGTPGQLGLELGEALDGVPVDDDPGLVQAQLDGRLDRSRSRACAGTGGS